MGFGNSFMRALGFGGQSDDDYENESDSPTTVPDDTSRGEESEAAQSSEPHVAQSAVDVDRVTLDIFSTVVETFNNALPAFLRDAVDPEAQKKHLFNQLDKSVKEQLALATRIAREKSEANWQQRQAGLRAEVETYKEKLRQTEEKQGAARQAKLSAERQKRALTERVHDLESQVSRLEADAEQTELEKKSLVNKLKVANVHEEDTAALREEVNRLQAELNRLKAGAVNEEMADNQQPDPSASVPNEEIVNLRAEVATLKESLALVNEELASTRESLDSATEDLKIAEEIQSQLEKFEDVKKRQDSRINNLKKKNQELNRRLEEALACIERFRAEKEMNPGDTGPDEHTDIPSDTDMHMAIHRTSDALFEVAFDESSWIGEPTPAPIAAEDPLDFGYKPPRKKSAPPADDATHQLSLW